MCVIRYMRLLPLAALRRDQEQVHSVAGTQWSSHHHHHLQQFHLFNIPWIKSNLILFFIGLSLFPFGRSFSCLELFSYFFSSSLATAHAVQSPCLTTKKNHLT